MRRATTLLLVTIASLSTPHGGSAQLAQQLYGSACADGDYDACNVFGLMYETGQGVPQDLERAYELYDDACEGGLLVGCTNLGLLYGRGLGTAQDLERARGRYETACEGGDELGCELLSVIDSAAAPADADLFDKKGQIGDGQTYGALAGAVVELPQVGRREVSDGEGRVSFEGLPAGEYDVSVERFGYLDIEGTVQVPGRESFLVLMDRMEMEDPDAVGTIVGRVTDEGSGPLSDVDISVIGQESARAISGQRGRFTLEGIAPGLVEVRFTRLGYSPRTARLVVQPGRTAELEVAMPTDAIELDPIEVTVRAASLERQGFYRRRDTGFGTFFDAQRLNQLQSIYLADVVRRAPGIRVSVPGSDQPDGTGAVVGGPTYAMNPTVVSPTNGACYLALYVDGVRLSDPDLQQVDPANIEAVEVYVGGNVPVEYQALNPCGAILVWLKR